MEERANVANMILKQTKPSTFDEGNNRDQSERWMVTSICLRSSSDHPGVDRFVAIDEGGDTLDISIPSRIRSYPGSHLVHGRQIVND